MIIEAIFNLLFGLIVIIIDMFPKINTLPNWIQDFINIIKVPLSIFPLDVWVTVIGSVIMWYGLQFGWSLVEWIYKKIPGVD